MPLIEIVHRLEIYDAAGSSVELTYSTDNGDTLPYLGSTPVVDGQTFDPLTGDTMAGRAIGTIVDAITSGTDRALTAQLEDANYRQRLMGRKAIYTLLADGVPEVLCAGKLTRLSLGELAQYDWEVTDNTALQGRKKLFAPKSGVCVLTAGAAIAATSLTVAPLTVAMPKGTFLVFGGGKTATTTAAAAVSATSVAVSALVKAVVTGDQATYREGIADFLARWPNRGCAFGGPIIGGFLDQPSRPGWLMRMSEASSGAKPLLQFVMGSGPKNFNLVQTSIADPSIADATNNMVGSYTPRGGVDQYGVPMAVTAPITTFDQAEKSPFAHDLVVEVTQPDGTSYGYYQPNILALTVGDDRKSQLVQYGHDGSGGRPAYPDGVWLTLTSSGLPATGTMVRARAFTVNPSAISPICHTAHPVDWITAALDELGYSYDQTSADDTKEALGNDLRYSELITETKPTAWLKDTFLGPFGIGLRMKDDGDLEFFASRIFENTPPAVEITADDVVTPEEGGAGPVFEITEQTAIAKVVVQCKSMKHTSGGDSSDYPTYGIEVQDVTIERKNGDPGVVGDREMTWTLGGMVHRVGKNGDDRTYWDAPIKEVFDRYGRGLVTGELPLLRGGSGDGVKLGQEIINSVPQLPNHNKRLTDVPATPGRAMQVIRLTKRDFGALALLADSGPNAQPFATAPTHTMAASATYPNTVAELTITNAATLNAAGAGLRIRMAVTTGGAPSAGDFADALVFLPGQIPTTAIALPSVEAGRKVYAIARAETVVDRPSDYTAAVSATLTAFTDPSAVVATPDGSDGTLAVVAWTPGEAPLMTDIYLRLQADTADADVLIASLAAGSDRYDILHLIEGTNYTVSVQHRDPLSGDTSAKVEDDFTTSGSAATIDPPTGERGFAGRQDDALRLGLPNDPGLCGIAVKVASFPMDVEGEVTVEDSVGAGTFSGGYEVFARSSARQGTWTPLTMIAPNDGLTRRFRARAVRPTQSTSDQASSYTSTKDVIPFTPQPIQRTTKTLRGFWQEAGWKTQNGPVVSTEYKGSGTALTVTADNTPYNVRHYINLPDGATITATRATVFRGNASAVITHTLYRVVLSSFTIVGSTRTSVSTGSNETLDTAPLTELTTGNYYAVEVTLEKGVGQPSTNAKAFTWEVDYEVDYLDDSL